MIEFKSELQNVKEDMDNGFASLGKRFSSIEHYATNVEKEAILFKKFTTKLIEFIANATFLIIGILIMYIYLGR